MIALIRAGTEIRIRYHLKSINKKFVRKFNNFILTDPDYFIENKNGVILRAFYLIVTKMALILNYRILYLLGDRLSYLFGILLLKRRKYDKSYKYFEKSQNNNLVEIYSILNILDHFYLNDYDNYEKQLDRYFTKANLDSGVLDRINNWAFWGTNHSNFTNLLQRKISLLTRYYESEEIGTRILPNHTSHMGHIGYLKKYIDYYSNFDRDRSICIWPDISPNKYYLTKVIESSELKIKLLPGKPPVNFHNIASIDRLSHSRTANGSWRTDLSAGSFSGQNFPELLAKNSNYLSISSAEDNRAEPFLEKLGIDKSKWIVCLHVRQVMKERKASIRAEDSKIEHYFDFCEAVNGLGGQVVRMGNSDFPRLSNDFPAIDYAYSEYKSDFLDTWLWGRCRWWTGNFNGASMPPLTFGVPRLITDAWAWDINGSNNDFIIPKLLIDKSNDRILTVKETINHKLGRNTVSKRFHEQNLELLDNSPEDLHKAALFMFNETQSNQKSDPSNLGRNDLLLTELRAPTGTPAMRVPDFLNLNDELICKNKWIEKHK